jgi:hypothetical protein
MALLLALLALGGRLSQGQQPEPADEAKAIRATNRAAVIKRQKSNEQRARDNADLMARHGLLADRKARRITLDVEATGLKEGDIAEFFMISLTSGHSYESLLISFAAPGDVIRALEFIGMTRGRPARHDRLQFWPKGERVFVNLHHGDRVIPMEHCITNTQTQALLPKTGFVFTGSIIEDGSNPPVYLADTREPGSLASNYNEAESVLDLPHSAPQKSVYRRQSVSALGALPPGTLLQVTIEPEHKDGTKRVRDLILTIAPTDGDALEMAVTTPDGTRVTRNGKLNTALEFFTKEVAAQRDPHVSIRFDERLAVGQIRPVCELLRPIDSTKGIRVEPPAPGQIYYKGFMPRDSFRDRKQRMAQPWELFLTGKGDTAKARLVRIAEAWERGSTRPTLTPHEQALAGPGDLAKAIADDAAAAKADKKRQRVLPVLLIFASKELSYGAVSAYVKAMPETHRTIYIFAE